MLGTYYTETLIGFKDLVLDNVRTNETDMVIQCHLRPKLHNCPACGHQTSKVHDYRIQNIKDAPMRGLNVTFLYKKRRYCCPLCKKRFYEKNTLAPRYHRMTTRLIQFIIKKMHATHSMTSIARECNISITTIFRVFKYISYTNSYMPEVLSIDEFKGNAGRKFQCILTDPKSHKVLDILEGREKHILSAYFSTFKDRANVKYFVMDMWKPYKDIAETYFKNATIVIDKYHFIRQITWAFDRIRRDLQKELHPHRRKYFKRSRWLLLKRMRKLSDEQKDAANVMLDASTKLSDAYMLKEKFYEFIDATSYGEAVKKLHAWYMFVSVSDLPAFDTCMQTMINWEPYILNSFKCSYTNGYTEGVNNKIKVLKRNAYGVRNFERFRTRILHVMQ
jgi:transposase